MMTEIAKSLFNRQDTEFMVTLNDLIAIILYCDYTDLSADFTLSFRKRYVFETLQSVKRRNVKKYHWSKTLKYVIASYGQSFNGQDDDHDHG